LPISKLIRALIALTVLIGLGSLAFHLFATVGTQWLDLLFIEIFIYVYLAAFMRLIVRADISATIATLFAFAFFEWLLTRSFAPGSLNGSFRYLPALCGLTAMFGAACLLRRRVGGAVARDLAVAASLFALAIVLRALDLQLCSIWPAGTHFLWHLLNACVLYWAIAGLINEQRDGNPLAQTQWPPPL
jgi:hypothetical protein